MAFILEGQTTCQVNSREMVLMPRDLVVGNGRLLINFDHNLNMRDLYYPYVGMPNHIGGHYNRIGLWVNGRFTWVGDTSWEKVCQYEPATLVTDARVMHPGLAVTLHLHDAVHFTYDLYLKQIRVVNKANRPREFRIFLTHDFSINETDIGDTALYDPNFDAVLHYKRDICFLISGNGNGEGLFQYATGIKRFGGAEGTWRDAEDGWLEGNPISQGSVDSTVSFRVDLGPGEMGVINYWIAAGHRFEDVWEVAGEVRHRGVVSLMDEVRAYWHSWTHKGRWDFQGLSPAVEEEFRRSLLVIRTQIDRRGAVLAANDTDILQHNRDHYSYMWPRDGALVAYALDRAGYPEVTRPIYRFCRDALSPGGFLWHKYNPDGSVGSSWHPWVRAKQPQLPIQEDETALVLFALWHFYEREHDLEFIESLYRPFILKAGQFLHDYRDPDTGLPLESYDLWEERRGVFTFTACAVYAGLKAAARFGRLFGYRDTYREFRAASREIKRAIVRHLFDERLNRFIRGLYRKPDGTYAKDTTLESSLWALFGLGVFSPYDERVEATMKALEDGLWVKTPTGGMARYYHDYYFQKSSDIERVPGNPWFICTLWLAQWYIATAREARRLQRAADILEWATAHALESGVMSEQIHPYTGEPVSVAPLTWSHATFVQTVVDYLEKAKELEEKEVMARTWHESGGM